MTGERKKLVKRLDTLCREILLQRDRFYGEMFCCISCRRLLPLNCAQVGHYVSRRYESYRWDLRNIHLECNSCNNPQWGSTSLIEYRKSLVEMYGEEEVSNIEATYRKSPKYSVFDLKLLVAEYQKKLKELKEEGIHG